MLSLKNIANNNLKIKSTVEMTCQFCFTETKFNYPINLTRLDRKGAYFDQEFKKIEYLFFLFSCILNGCILISAKQQYKNKY